MKKLISIFAVLLVLVFSCVPAFAESQVIDGYAVVDVPYNKAFDGVLTASDNGSQLYSSSENRTYNTPSVMSAPSTTVKPLYTSKSVVNMIPQNAWRISDGVSKTFPIENGFAGVQYNWANGASPSAPHSISHLTNIPSFDFFKSERKYRITFDLIIKSNSKGTFTFDIVSSSDSSHVIIPLCSVEARVGTGSTLGQGSRLYSIDFTLPSGTEPLLQPKISVSLLTGSEFLFFINDFTITDITTEDLDNSIDKGVQKIEDAGSDEPPLDTDISAFQSAIDTMNGWLDQLNEFADTIDTAGDSAKDYISKGTELFNGFMGVAPASVIALIAFGIVFLVIRKIVGR